MLNNLIAKMMNKETMKMYYVHGLRVVDTTSRNKSFLVKTFGEKTYILKSYWPKEYEIEYESPDYIPILYPLKHLNTDIKIGGRELVNPLNLIGQLLALRSSVLLSADNDLWFRNILIDYFNNRGIVPFRHNVMLKIYDLMYRLHFDLDHLIEKGEALDVKTLQWNPYEFDDIILEDL